MEAEPEEWMPILSKSYKFLRNLGVGDLTVYGSQSLMFFLDKPLASKNIDLLGSVNINQVIELSRYLMEMERFEVRKIVEGYIYTIYAKTSLGKPIVVEVFTSTPLGTVSDLTEYIVEKEIYGEKYWTITPSLYIALKLASHHSLTARDVEIINKVIDITNLNEIVEIIRRRRKVEDSKRKLTEAIEKKLKIKNILLEVFNIKLNENMDNPFSY